MNGNCTNTREHTIVTVNWDTRVMAESAVISTSALLGLMPATQQLPAPTSLDCTVVHATLPTGEMERIARMLGATKILLST